ncbi:P-loop NTPase fold protein [Nonomuraea sp. NPDC050227]|uniref:P-loop NTPase fold protein n=1 Tax=Nonomuraea sp. NPDC050227 TaxID=3364360 RepID=UPI0037A342BB
MPIARLFVVVVLAVGTGFGAPQFLDNSALSISLETFPRVPVQVTVVNPGPAVTARIQVAGPAASAVSVQGGGSVQLPAGGNVTVTLVPGPRLRETSGQLVLYAETGVTRRELRVVPRHLLLRLWPHLAGGLLLVGLLAWLMWRRRRPLVEPAPSPKEEEQAPAGFTHSDEPAVTDSLGRAEYAQALALLAHSASPPMVIGVYGDWGIGKTSLLKQVRQVIDDQYGDCAHVWFDPWRHQYDDNPVLPLLHTLVAELGLAKKEQVARTLRTISEVLGSLVLSSTARVNLADVRSSLKEYDEQHFRIRSDRARLDEYLTDLIAQALAETGKKRLVVFIDDLDRCAGDQVAGLLEALKLHFNRDNCVFFLAVAKEPLLVALGEKYKGLQVDHYLDKIIQFPFEMPRLSAAAFDDYLRSLLPEEIMPTRDLLRIGLPRNPRSIKRFLNVLILQDRIAKARKLSPYDVSTLAAILLIREGDGEFYARLAQDASLLQRIKEDLDTAEEGRQLDWSQLPLQLISRFRDSHRAVPADVSAYIDLVRSTPIPEHSEEESKAVPPVGQPLVAAARGELAEGLAVLAERVERQVGQLLPAGGAVLAQDLDMDGRAITLDDLVARWDRGLLVVGASGAGKTVLAARITLRLLEEGGGPVPVFVSLRSLDLSRPGFEMWMTHALVQQYRTPITEALAMVNRQRLIYVLDGLDEVADPADRDKIAQEVVRWHEVTGAKITVTDRHPGPGHPLVVHQDFVKVRVKGVTEQEMSRLLGAWKGSAADAEELAGAPALLANLTDSWLREASADGRDLVELYADRAMAMLDDGPALQEILRDVARHLISRDGTSFDDESREIRNIFRHHGKHGRQVPQSLEELVRAGLLRRLSTNEYQFVHHRLLKHFAEGGSGQQ